MALHDPASLTAVEDWSRYSEQHWAGPSIWLNRLQDWVVRDGGLETVTPSSAFAARTAHVLTHELTEQREPFVVTVMVDRLTDNSEDGWSGFLVGAGEGRLDYRAAALVHHDPGKYGGILCVLQDEGGLDFLDMGSPAETGYPRLAGRQVTKPYEGPHEGAVLLQLEGHPGKSSLYTLRLSIWDPKTGLLLAAATVQHIPGQRLRGNVAIVSHPGAGDSPARHRFDDLRAGGNRFVHRPERAFGPIAGTLFSLTGDRLKLGVQFVHLGQAILPKPAGVRQRFSPVHVAALERRLLDEPSAAWTQAAPAQAITTPDYYTVFCVDGWGSARDWETRVVYTDHSGETHYYRTVVPREPKGDIVSLAAFTGMGVMARPAHGPPPRVPPGETLLGRWTPANVWFPFAETVAAVDSQDVDILFFTGDQIYQNKPTHAEPDDRYPAKDYLYKWLLWHWAFRDLTNHLPAIVQADDHDVYQGNIWGWSGRMNTTGHENDGGYICSPAFINLVYRTMTSHNPDPYAQAAPKNGIRSYFCGFTYGGISFAVLEDRAFKTPPTVTNPAEQELLGPAQEAFLAEWAKDRAGGAMKVAVSQSVYASMHVDFDGNLVADHDSGGWPKPGRDRVVRLLEEANAFLVSGDQHLATLVQLGVDGTSDGVYQFCVPAAGNIFWRWFYPNQEGGNRNPGDPPHLGDFEDSFGNSFRMIAVANPEERSLLGEVRRYRPTLPTDASLEEPMDTKRAAKGDGYGVVRLDKTRKTITVECWPYDADPSGPNLQYQGWPVTLDAASK